MVVHGKRPGPRFRQAPRSVWACCPFREGAVCTVCSTQRSRTHFLQGEGRGWARSQKQLYQGQMELSPEAAQSRPCRIPQWSRGARRAWWGPDVCSSACLHCGPRQVSHWAPHRSLPRHCHPAPSEGQFLKWIFLQTTWQSLDIKYRDVCWKLFIPSCLMHNLPGMVLIHTDPRV